jgi:hypothetical protein
VSATAEAYTSREAIEPRVIPNGQLIGRVKIGARTLSLAGVTASVTIRFGRVDPSDPPTASSISLDLIDLTDAHPIACGDLIEVDLIGAIPRFRGWVMDLAQTWGDTGSLTVVEVGNLRDLSPQIGGADWPQGPGRRRSRLRGRQDGACGVGTENPRWPLASRA